MAKQTKSQKRQEAARKRTGLTTAQKVANTRANKIAKLRKVVANNPADHTAKYALQQMLLGWK